jgi:putative hydroxymethylpyrimidine transport system substrate-binding protein
MPLSALRTRLALLAGVLALALGACGADDEQPPRPGPGGEAHPEEPVRATLVLDFVPNAVHAGIFRALEQGYYAAEGLDLRVVEPSGTADALRLVDGGRADLGLADAIDVAGQVARGRDAKAVMALVQRPLGGVVTRADAGIGRPRDLAGRTVGMTGVPSDAAVLDTILADDGVAPGDVERVTIGFNGVQNLLGGSVDAFLGYVAADGTQVESAGEPVRSFPLDEHGGPRYPGLLAFTTERRIQDDPGLMRAFVAASVRGYEEAIADPAAALEDLLAANPALRRPLARAQLEAYRGLFRAGAPRFGALAPERLEALSAFLIETGLLGAPVAPERLATEAFLP